MRGLSLVAASGGHSSSRCAGLSLSRPLTVAASLVAEHRLQMCRLSSCGSRAQLLCGMWDLPRPGLEPMSPALAGGFSTTAPPGKPRIWFNVDIYPKNARCQHALKLPNLVTFCIFVLLLIAKIDFFCSSL